MIEKREFDNFDVFAKDYRKTHDEVVKMSGTNSTYFSEYKIIELMKFENTQANFKILDFGCGDGNSSLFIRKHFPNATIFGVDVSEESINIAKRKNIDAADFTAFDGLKLPYEEGEFDVIFTSMVFHHIEHRLHHSVIKEIYRVLKKGGRFYNFEHNPYNFLTRKVVRECVFDKDAVLLKPSYNKKVTEKNGFNVEQLNYTLFFPRQKIFSIFHKLESMLSWFPLGAQYYIRAIK